MSKESSPKCKSFLVLAFQWLHLFSPLSDCTKRPLLAHAVNKSLKILLARDLLAEEFGVDGPVCDAVAKKPWLASVMSCCSLASASPMEMFPVSASRVCPEEGVLRSQLARLSPAAPTTKMQWEAHVPYFLTPLPLGF